MFNWLYKRLGYHVCERFTKWEAKSVLCKRAPADSYEFTACGDDGRVRFTKCWQERNCVECGKIEQKSLAYANPEA